MTDLRDCIIRLNGSRGNSDESYKFFFDETGNNRSFSLTRTGFSSNESKFFVLGGIVTKRDISSKTIKRLWNSIPESNRQEELKFKTIRQGAKNFPDLLKKTHFQKVVNWLYKNYYWIHFYYIDNFYFSIVDIVDSLDFESKYWTQNWNHHLKSALYRAVKYNKEKSVDIFRCTMYPDVEDYKLFLSFMDDIIEDFMRSDEYKRRYLDKRDMSLEVIREQFTQARGSLPFLNNNTPGKLIDDYTAPYLLRIALFRNSKLVFDHELEVENQLERLNLGNSNYTFVESSIPQAKEKNKFIDDKTHELIQLSDIIVGTMGMFLEYINSDDVKTLKNISESMTWNASQRETYDKWKSVIKRSVQENSFFKESVTDELFENKFNFYIGERFPVKA